MNQSLIKLLKTFAKLKSIPKEKLIIIMQKLTILLLILMTTSCCNRYKTSLSQEQVANLANTLPDYPKLNTFTIKEQEYIAGIPAPLKIYITEVVEITKCIKNQKCKN